MAFLSNNPGVVKSQKFYRMNFEDIKNKNYLVDGIDNSLYFDKN